MIENQLNPLQRFIAITFLFYRSILTYNIIFTFATQAFMSINGLTPNTISFLLAKIVGISSAIAFNNYQYKQSYFYYRNAGYHMRWVIASAFAIDILLYLTIAILASAIFNIWPH